MDIIHICFLIVNERIQKFKIKVKLKNEEYIKFNIYIFNKQLKYFKDLNVAIKDKL